MENLMTIEKFNNVIRMLESSDEENRVLALTIIEQQDFVGNLAFILLCRKRGSADRKLWEEHSPTTWEKMSKIEGLDMNKAFTYKVILRALTEVKAPIPQIQFYMNEFSNHILGQLQNLGYEFIENIEFIVKVKDHDPIGKSIKSD
jgi:hypothetical protein